MDSAILTIEQLVAAGGRPPPDPWQLRIVRSDQCLSYVAWNQDSREALLVDPKREDREAYFAISAELRGYRWIAVLDTHTHADHVSAAFELSEKLRAPVVMHATSPSSRVHLRVAKDTSIPAQAAPLRLFLTPGHTGDSLTAIWGPFLFSGDTILYGDTGRDDLPGGSPEAHFESVAKIKSAATPELLLLAGHDFQGGRISSWATQLEINSSLTQSREDFLREARAFDAPAPALLKESLRENFK